MAKSGQVLYLVQKPTLPEDFQEVNFEIKTSPKVYKNQIRRTDIKWSFDGTNSFDNYGEKKIKRNLRAREAEYETSVTTGYQNQTERSVDIKWIKEDKQTHKVIPPAIQSQVEDIFEKVKTIKKIIDRYTSDRIKIEPKIEIRGTQRNKEDKETRFYKTIRDGSIEAKVDVKYKVKLPPPYSWELKIPFSNINLGKIGAFIDLKASIGISGVLTYEKRNDKDYFKKTKNTIQAKGSGGAEFGVKADILSNVENVTIEIKAYGKATLNVAGKLVIKSNDDIEFKPTIYFDPLIGAFKGKIMAGGITVFDQSHEWQLLDRFTIYPKRND